jgi:sterol desaturase/sphingolipid hydroxylase (fatty acid hydroxylase superfamily)
MTILKKLKLVVITNITSGFTFGVVTIFYINMNYNPFLNVVTILSIILFILSYFTLLILIYLALKSQ